MKRRVLLLSAFSVVALLAGCQQTTPPTSSSSQAPTLETVNGDGETLRLSVKYQKSKSTMKFDAEGLKSCGGEYHAADGNTYKAGEFKPVWKEIQNNLKFTIEDVTDLTQTSIGDSFTKVWAAKGFDGVDVLNGNSTSINEYGVTNNSFVPLDEYLDYMPAFKQFLADNPIVDTSIRAGDGHIYYAPYFDGYNDLERMFICRQDWVRKLLDDDSVTYDTATVLSAIEYEPYMPASLNVDIAVPSGKITKNYAKNVITVQNELASANGASLVKALKDHIDATYGNQYEKRSDLFLSTDAAYDADELIALFRCVKTNPILLTGQSTASVVPFYPREYKANRLPDLFRLAAIWGVRGLESRAEYLFVDKNGELRDARNEASTRDALVRMNDLYKEGLLLANFDENSGSGNWRTDYNAQVKGGTDSLGFCTYDYNQTTVALNASGQKFNANFDLAPMMPAVANWDDGDDSTSYFHFTESVRSVKTDGWCINVKLMEDLPKFKKALELFNYPYTEEGNTLVSYGPSAWLEETPTVEYMGEKVPTLNAKALAELNDPTIGNGNYTNYYRFFLGGTLPIGYVKQQGMEFQCTHPTGQAGLDRVIAAWSAGTLKRITPKLAEGQNPFYSMVPTTFSFTKIEENLKASTFAELSANFQATSSGYIMFSDVVKGTMTIEEYESEIKNNNIEAFIELYSAVYARMIAAE